MGRNAEPRQPREGTLWVNPATNAVVVGPEADAGAKERLYFGRDLDAALRSWGKLNDYPGAFADARRIVDDVVAAEGSPILEVFFLPSTKQYVSVVLENEPNRGAAFVNVGFVDFRCDLPGALSAKNTEVVDGEELRRIHLASGRRSTEGSTRGLPKSYGVCDVCHWHRSATGACGCD